jgi:hypothetical protein
VATILFISCSQKEYIVTECKDYKFRTVEQKEFQLVVENNDTTTMNKYIPTIKSFIGHQRQQIEFLNNQIKYYKELNNVK